ncbi:hypothetical protein Acsp05_51020 [Actinokineospora sp. NBRC 105648]|nr:hypothetical protein Acsp05_51020 [Actinokineospora sp. NBRC 105648]
MIAADTSTRISSDTAVLLIGRRWVYTWADRGWLFRRVRSCRSRSDPGLGCPDPWVPVNDRSGSTAPPIRFTRRCGWCPADRPGNPGEVREQGHGVTQISTHGVLGQTTFEGEVAFVFGQHQLNVVGQGFANTSKPTAAGSCGGMRHLRHAGPRGAPGQASPRPK